MKLIQVTENQKIKMYRWAGAGLFIFFCWLLFAPVKEEFLNVGPPDMKRITLEEVKVVGFKKSKRTWDITAEYVWSPRDTDRATLENVSDGNAYDNNRLVLTRLQARKVVANSTMELLTAEEGVKAYLIRRGEKADNINERILIWAETMSYSGQQKKSIVKGSIRIQQKDAGVYAAAGEIDHEKDTVTFEAPFKIIQNNAFLTADTLQTYLHKEQFVMEGNAKMIRKKEAINTKNIDKREVVFKKEDLQINADRIDFSSAEKNAAADLIGHIVVVQPGKKAFGDIGHYDEKKDFVELQKSAAKTEQAGLVLDKADWLIDDQTLEKLKDPKTRETFSKQTTIFADKIKMRIDEKDVVADGNVKVRQKGRYAHAEKAYYVEEAEKIKLVGNVKFQREDGTWLSAAEAVVSLKDNTFSAVGEVETSIMIEN